jgi:streptogramin lyase
MRPLTAAFVLASIVSACAGSSSSAPTGPSASPGSTGAASSALVIPASLPAGTIGIDLGGETNGLTICGDSLWAAVSAESEFIAQVDPSSAKLRGRVAGGVNLACLDGQPWAAASTAIQHLDPKTGAVLTSVSLSNAYYVGIGAGSVWSASGKNVVRIDPATAKIVATIAVGAGDDVTEVDGSNDEAIWATVKEANKVYRIDPAKNKVVAEIGAGAFAHGILVQPDAVWISNAHEGSVTRIDPATNAPTTVQGPGSGVGLAEGAGFVWASSRQGDLYRIDPKTRVPTLVGHVDGWPYGIAFADDVLWVSDGVSAVYGIPIASLLPSS